MGSSDVNRSLSRHLRAKGKAGAEVFHCELRVVFQNLIHRHPPSEEVEDQRDPTIAESSRATVSGDDTASALPVG